MCIVATAMWTVLVFKTGQYGRRFFLFIFHLVTLNLVIFHQHDKVIICDRIASFVIASGTPTWSLQICIEIIGALFAYGAAGVVLAVAGCLVVSVAGLVPQPVMVVVFRGGIVPQLVPVVVLSVCLVVFLAVCLVSLDATSSDRAVTVAPSDCSGVMKKAAIAATTRMEACRCNKNLKSEN